MGPATITNEWREARYREMRGVGVGSGGTVGGAPTVDAASIAINTMITMPSTMNAITF